MREQVPAVAATQPYTVVYDGTCRVCTRIAGLIREWDRKHDIEVVASQAPGVMDRFPWIPPEAYTEALQMIGPDGRTWQGADAVEQILRVLPRGRFFTWAYRIPFIRVLADKLYRWFARNRYRFGCSEHCDVRSHGVRVD